MDESKSTARLGNQPRFLFWSAAVLKTSRSVPHAPAL